MKPSWSFFLLIFLMLSVTCLGQYPMLRISMKSGLEIKGKEGLITPDSVIFNQNGVFKAIPLSDVRVIDAKRNLGPKVGGIVAGSCLGLSLGVLIANGGQVMAEDKYGRKEDVTSAFVVGSLMWAGILGGAGCLIGTLMDNWSPVFINQDKSSLHKNWHFYAGPVSHKELAVKLVYRF